MAVADREARPFSATPKRGSRNAGAQANLGRTDSPFQHVTDWSAGRLRVSFTGLQTRCVMPGILTLRLQLGLPVTAQFFAAAARSHIAITVERPVEGRLCTQLVTYSLVALRLTVPI